MSAENRALADSVGMNVDTWKKYVDMIRMRRESGNFVEARKLYQEIVETYGYVRIADAIYAESRNNE